MTKKKTHVLRSKENEVGMYNCPGYCLLCPHTAYVYLEECSDRRCDCHAEFAQASSRGAGPSQVPGFPAGPSG